ncbi:hypothetical protein [uncultured Sphingomonas sp.]|uniref:hypothetical protein n=1 Tax=uncultured Sphingomonas sp. TaxID=158754 RepID=UPI0035CC74BE
MGLTIELVWAMAGTAKAKRAIVTAGRILILHEGEGCYTITHSPGSNPGVAKKPIRTRYASRALTHSIKEK